MNKDDVKRIVIWGWSEGTSTVVIEQLVAEGVIDIVQWISPQQETSRRTKQFSYMPKLMIDELMQMDKKSDVYYKLDESQLSRDLCKFMDIYSRVNYSKGRDYHEHVNLFHLYYSYFSHVLISGDVDCVVFMGAPHVGVDYVLYLVAKSLDINVILIFQTHIHSRFFCVTDIDDYGLFETCPVEGEAMSLTIPPTFKKEHTYMINARNKRGLRIHKFIEECFRAVLPNRQPISWAGVFQNLSNRINSVHYYKKYVQKKVNFDCKFVYFALQFQPELTTSTLGYEYSDQLLAIEKISTLIPDDWFIYVKENPKQGVEQRNELFYKRMARIKNCRYLSEDIGTYDLIEYSQFVSAITGTVCWEAISGGKPALVFGVTWYMTLPGVIIYHSGLNLEAIMNTEFTHENLELEYSEIMSKTIPGIIGLEYCVPSKEKEHVENEILVLKFFRDVFLRI